MKRFISIFLVLALVMTTFAALAADFSGVLTFYRGVDVNFSSAKIPVRTGPSTEFTERATYTLRNAKVISRSVDNKGKAWVQIEFKYNNQLTRGYTTASEVRMVGGVPDERSFNQFYAWDEAMVYYSQWAYTGPGYNYMRSDDLYLYNSETYWLIAQENGWGLEIGRAHV